jgi:hypothetical protein
MSGEKLGPAATRRDILHYIREHPEGVSVSIQNLNQAALDRKWSPVVDQVKYVQSGLKALGVVKIHNTKSDTVAIPVKDPSTES